MFKTRLRELREAMGLTQEELAERAGFEVLQIWRYENGRSKPNIDYIAQLAQALHVSADYLLCLSDDPTPSELTGSLSALERSVLSALRRGEGYEAIKAIVAAEATK